MPLHWSSVPINTNFLLPQPLAPPSNSSYLYGSVTLGTSCEWHPAVCVLLCLLISLSTVSSLTLEQVSEWSSFSRLSHIPLYEWTTGCRWTQLPFAMVNDIVMNTGVHTVGQAPGVYTEVGWLGHVGILFQSFEKAPCCLP
jgi:hypothetical protein